MRKMITMYDHNMRDVFPHYLDGSMEAFMANQERINEQFTQLWGGYNAVEKLEKVEEITQKNIEMMQNTMQLFNPFEYLAKKD